MDTPKNLSGLRTIWSNYLYEAVELSQLSEDFPRAYLIDTLARYSKRQEEESLGMDVILRRRKPYTTLSELHIQNPDPKLFRELGEGCLLVAGMFIERSDEVLRNGYKDIGITAYSNSYARSKKSLSEPNLKISDKLFSEMIGALQKMKAHNQEKVISTLRRARKGENDDHNFHDQ